MEQTNIKLSCSEMPIIPNSCEERKRKDEENAIFSTMRFRVYATVSTGDEDWSTKHNNDISVGLASARPNNIVLATTSILCSLHN